MVSEHLKRHSHEVRPELGYRPHDSQALQFSGRVGFLRLVESPGSGADDALLAIADLSQDSAEACSGGVGVQPKGLSEVREGSDGAGCEQGFQLIEGGLAFGAPVEDCIFPGQSVQRTGNRGEVLYISPVITGETQEGADFRGSIGRWDLPYGCEERGIWQKAFFGNLVAQVADLFRSKRALLSPQLEIGVPESLKRLVGVERGAPPRWRRRR